jgi:hypothetical protein
VPAGGAPGGGGSPLPAPVDEIVTGVTGTVGGTVEGTTGAVGGTLDGVLPGAGAPVSEIGAGLGGRSAPRPSSAPHRG